MMTLLCWAAFDALVSALSQGQKTPKAQSPYTQPKILMPLLQPCQRSFQTQGRYITTKHNRDFQFPIPKTSVQIFSSPVPMDQVMRRNQVALQSPNLKPHQIIPQRQTTKPQSSDPTSSLAADFCPLGHLHCRNRSS